MSSNQSNLNLMTHQNQTNPHARSCSSSSKRTNTSLHTPLAVILAPGKAQVSQPTTQLLGSRPSNLSLRQVGSQKTRVTSRARLSQIISSKAFTSPPTTITSNPQTPTQPSKQRTSSSFPSPIHPPIQPSPPQPITGAPIQDPPRRPSKDLYQSSSDQQTRPKEMLKVNRWLPTRSPSSNPPSVTHAEEQTDAAHTSSPQTSITATSSIPGALSSSPLTFDSPSLDIGAGPSLPIVSHAHRIEDPVPKPKSTSSQRSSWFGFSRKPPDQTLPSSSSSPLAPTPLPISQSTLTSVSTTTQFANITPVLETMHSSAPISKPTQSSLSTWYPKFTTTPSTTEPEGSSSKYRDSTGHLGDSDEHHREERFRLSGNSLNGSNDLPGSAPVALPCPGGAVPEGSTQRTPSPKPDSRSSWWGWGSNVPPELPTSASEVDSAPDSEIPSLVDATASPPKDVDSIPALTQADQTAYTTRIGHWMYSWYDNSASEPPSTESADPSASPDVTEQLSSEPHTDPNLISNPISQSIPTNSRGWAGLFSTRRVIPMREVEDERRSVETMEIDFSGSSADDRQHGSPAPSPSAPLLPLGSSIFSKFTSLKGKEPARLQRLADPGSDGTAGPDETGTANFAAQDPQTGSSSKRRYNSQTTLEVEAEPPKSKIHSPLTDSSLPPSKILIRNGKARATMPNLVLPTFDDTFMHPPRSFLPKSFSNNKLKQTIDLVQAYIFSVPPTSPDSEADEAQAHDKALRDLLHKNNHISTRLPRALSVLGVDQATRLKDLRKVCVIGIHGWFPGPWLETVIGKPTGTSEKFVGMMSSSVRDYVEQHLGGSLNQEFMTLIPLEGDGKVDVRVENLYKELYKRPDWVESLHAADVIFVVAHSQGSVVSCKLLERLIKKDGVRGERVMLLCMCGIWSGPVVGINNSYAFQPMLKVRERFHFFQDGKLAHLPLL